MSFNPTGGVPSKQNRLKLEGIVYMYTNLLNRKKYVGETINEKRRRTQHFQSYKKGKQLIHRAMMKYGFEHFQYTILERVYASTKEELKDRLRSRERYYIYKHQAFYDGYNNTR